MNKGLWSVCTIPLLVACQSTNQGNTKTVETWSTPQAGATPTFVNEEFNRLKVSAITEFESFINHTAPFDVSHFVECPVSLAKKTQLVGYDKVAKIYEINFGGLTLNSINVKSDRTGCEVLKNGDKGSAQFYSTFAYVDSTGEHETKTIQYLSQTTFSKTYLAKTTMTLSGQTYVSHSYHYDKEREDLIISKHAFSDYYTFSEYARSPDNQDIHIGYDGDLLQSIVYGRNDMMDGFSTVYIRDPHIGCYKQGKALDNHEYCEELDYSTELVQIAQKASAAKKPTKVVTVIQLPESYQKSSIDVSEFWSMLASALANSSILNSDLTSSGVSHTSNHSVHSVNTSSSLSNTTTRSNADITLSSQEVKTDPSFRDISYYRGNGERVPSNKYVPPCFEFTPVRDFEQRFIKQCLNQYPGADHSCVTQASLKAEHVWMEQYGHLLNKVCPKPNFQPKSGNAIEK